MHDYQRDFITFALEVEALKFGVFTLKSGRKSPYFFNAGLFNRANHLSRLGRFYAQAILDQNLSFDILFGPAYKGIPIATATALSLQDDHNIDCGVVFNRKELKKHGEGGQLIGSELAGKVLVLDDLITAGTAIREVISIIETTPAQLAGVVVAIDRQEKGQGNTSAIQEISKTYNIPVVSIIKLEQLIDFIKESEEFSHYSSSIEAYRNEYGVLD